MAYPTISKQRATAVAENVKTALRTDLETALNIATEEDTLEQSGYKGDSTYPREFVERQSHYLRERWETQFMKNSTAGEAWMAQHVHKLLDPLDDEIKRDQGFWRYLALFPFRWYLIYRAEDILPQSYGGLATVTDADGNVVRRRSSSFKNQLLFRTFLWGQIAYDPSAAEPYFRTTKFRETLKANSLKGSEIDIWHSHMIRVQLGYLGRMPHAFIDSMCKKEFTEVDPTHVLEKRQPDEAHGHIRRSSISRRQERWLTNKRQLFAHSFQRILRPRVRLAAIRV